MIYNDLVGGWPTPLKNIKVSWDDDIPNIWKNKNCSKPPTRIEVDDPHPECIFIICWLVVLTILKNISQWEGLSHIFCEN